MVGLTSANGKSYTMMTGMAMTCWKGSTMATKNSPYRTIMELQVHAAKLTRRRDEWRRRCERSEKEQRRIEQALKGLEKINAGLRAHNDDILATLSNVVITTHESGKEDHVDGREEAGRDNRSYGSVGGTI